MFKLTFTLAAALYAGFVIWGQPAEVAEAGDAAATGTLVLAEGAAAADYRSPVILETNASSRTDADVTRAAAVDPAAIVAAAPSPEATFRAPAPIGEPTRISLVAPAAVAAPAAAADPTAAPSATDGLLKVTGSRVNLRAGPSTGNAVVDSLVRGTLVEAVGEEINGWIELRDVTSGATGFMAANFLEPA